VPLGLLDGDIGDFKPPAKTDPSEHLITAESPGVAAMTVLPLTTT
jgi:hypothetical protein